MATRREKLNRLTISAPCEEPWDGMTVEGTRRHCARCDRQVFDFAGMTPRQIEARIEATGGRLCARITRSGDGQIITLPPPPQPFSWHERRASPIAAAMVTAFLGFGSTAGRAASPPGVEISAAPDRAPEPALPPSLRSDEEMDVVAPAPETITSTVTAGRMIAAPEPLHREFTESPLVVLGTAGASAALDPNEPDKVETELQLTTVFKGRSSDRTVRVEHWVYEEEGRFPPGTRVLAFLEPGDSRPGQPPTFVSADYNFGLKALPKPDMDAYAERLLALARIDRKGSPHPEDLAEWLVATVEEPLTRKEAIYDLQRAVEALAASAEKYRRPVALEADELQAEYADRLAEGKPISENETATFLGAFLTDAQRGRLTRALLATQDLQPADFSLYAIVASWSRDEALDWLIHWFKTTEEPDLAIAQRAMELLAGDLESSPLGELIAKANARIEAAREQAFSDDKTFEEDMAKFEAQTAAIQRELLRRFLASLSSPVPSAPAK